MRLLTTIGTLACRARAVSLPSGCRRKQQLRVSRPGLALARHDSRALHPGAAWRVVTAGTRMVQRCVREGWRLKKFAAGTEPSRVAPVPRRLVAGASPQRTALEVVIALEALAVSSHPWRADRVLLAARCT